MDPLSMFLGLISKTEGRDKTLRLIQYATLNSKMNAGMFSAVYDQIRMTRKILRFLRTLEYSGKVRKEIPELAGLTKNFKALLTKIFSIIENICTFLFYISDHRVCLGELKVIDKSYIALHYPKSMKYYFLQNVFGVFKNLMEMALIIFEQRVGEKKIDYDDITNEVKKRAFDLIRCMLDILVALFYWKGTIPAKKAGILGVITSVMAICQSLKLA